MQTLNIPDEFFKSHPVSLLQRDYNRVWELINDLWSTREGQEYLDNIVLMEPGNLDREGFPFEVFMELAELHNIHTELSVTYCKDFTGWKNPSPFR